MVPTQVLWDHLCHEESPSSSEGAAGILWDPPPVTPWEFDQSLNVIENGLLPSLKPLNPFKDVQVGEEMNKSSNINVTQTQSNLFSAENKGLPEGKDRLSCSGAQRGAAPKAENEEVGELRRTIQHQAKLLENLAEQQTLLTRQLWQLNSGEERVKSEWKETRNPWVANPTPIRMQKMSNTDDPEAYLHTFERVATAAGWPKEQWTLILIPCLTGVLQEVIDTLSVQEAAQYETVKGAILQTLNLTEEAYRKKFRELKFKPGMHPRPISQRMKANVIRWIKPEDKTKDEIIETVVMKHLISTLSNNMRSWVQRNRPKKLEEAIHLIENYCAAEEGSKEYTGGNSDKARPPDKMATGGSNTPRGPMSFSAIGRGRPANFEPMRPKPTRPITYDQRLFEPGTGLKEGKDGKPVCFDCGRPGHVWRQCPGLDCSWVGQNNEPVKLMGSEREGWEVMVLVNGQEKRALIDTGCSKTLVRHLEGNEVADEVSVRCIHGDSKKYATVWANVQIGNDCRRMKVGIAPGLSREMLLGRDWEGASELLNSKEGLVGECKLNQIETDFGKEVSREQTRMWQQDDPTLQEVLKEAQPTGTIVQGQEGFELEEGLLYHVNREGEKQLVVPMKWRKDVLKVAHDVPTAGHLANEKMIARISQRFWWPGMQKEIQQFCRTCKECQMTQTKPRPGAPLVPMPLVDHPFDRIGIDIVGPLTKSAGGHTHILVLIDYATRYPEAVPLRSTTAKVIARELMQVFTRLGFPKEILTDQGSNFMSLTLKEMWKLLDVDPVHTSVYHPQTNGLVERFNKTLKGMLRKLVMEKPRRWHLLVAPLMFAVREVPQASTGFSPFEMIYGWNPRGILDLIKEKWESGSDNSQITVKHVLEMREHLRKVSEISKEHLGQAQAGQKRRYDLRVSPRSFQTGQKVLLLLPAENAKLFARWQGPYEVIRQVGKVDYEIKTPDKKKKTGIYHVNLLKEWHEREALWAEDIQLCSKLFNPH
ncbi:uncharacterized protein LOC144586395 [Pogona vitticeps]